MIKQAGSLKVMYSTRTGNCRPDYEWVGTLINDLKLPLHVSPDLRNNVEQTAKETGPQRASSRTGHGD